MPKFVNGLPVDTGATDSLDSARLAGMMHIAGMGDYCNNYMVYDSQSNLYLGVRHPTDSYNGANNPNIFSRDQTLCLAAGLNPDMAYQLWLGAKKRGNKAQNWLDDVTGKPAWHGGDIMTPLHMETLEIKAEKRNKLSIIAKIILIISLLYNRFFRPLEEPNQLISICYITGNLKLFKIIWSSYKEAIRDYWSGWRGEPELAENLIKKIEEA